MGSQRMMVFGEDVHFAQAFHSKPCIDRIGGMQEALGCGFK